MIVKHGDGRTKYGPGVEIRLTGDEVATAIAAYLTAHDIYVSGPRTTRVNGELCKEGRVYVDPSGFVVADGERYDGGQATTAQKEREQAMPKTETEIKPCPFCGHAKPITSTEYDVMDRWRVVCEEGCGAQGPTENGDEDGDDTAEGAIELWNKRA